MATPSEKTRATLREHLSTEILAAAKAFDASVALKEIQDNFLAKAEDITRSLAGIDTCFGRIELSSKGIIRQYIEPEVKRMVLEYLTPLVKDEVPKFLAQRHVQTLIMNSIRREVKDNIRDLGGYKSLLRDQIEQMVTAEYQAVFNAWVDGQEDDTWLAQLGT